MDNNSLGEKAIKWLPLFHQILVPAGDPVAERLKDLTGVLMDCLKRGSKGKQIYHISVFKTFMHNFNSERLFMSAQACAFAQVCLDEAVDWARQRVTFGEPLSQRQVIRHKLVDMALKIDAARTLVYELAYRIEHRLADPQQLVARIAMAKVLSTQAMQHCADQAVQILGGMGFMRGTKSERIYREVKVMMIGGGSEEIMKDLAARQLGI